MSMDLNRTANNQLHQRASDERHGAHPCKREARRPRRPKAGARTEPAITAYRGHSTVLVPATSLPAEDACGDGDAGDERDGQENDVARVGQPPLAVPDTTKE